MAEKIGAEHKNLIYMHKKSIKLEGVRVLGTTLWSHVICCFKTTAVGRWGKNWSCWARLTTTEKLVWNLSSKKEGLLKFLILTLFLKKRSNGSQLNIYWHFSAGRRDQKSQRCWRMCIHYDSPCACSWLLRSKVLRKRNQWRFLYRVSHNSDIEFFSLKYLLGPPINVWAFGHTHWVKDDVQNGTRVVANCRGYPTEKTKWNPSLVLEIAPRPIVPKPTSKN